MREFSVVRRFGGVALIAWLAIAGAPDACAGDGRAAPKNYLFASGGALRDIEAMIRRPDIAGVQVVYPWKRLERGPEVYDFSAIEADLAYLESLDRALFVQLQDRFFSPEARRLPDDLLNDPVYGGGLVPQRASPDDPEGVLLGWAAVQWNTALRARYQKLIAALAQRFDGRIAGINLPETSIDIDMEGERWRSGFSCDRYFEATRQNAAFARRVFRRSAVVQYVNFWPCEWNNDRRYMSRLFEFAKRNGLGLGGPDIVPWKAGQMKNAYPFFHRDKGQLTLVAMAVQEPTLAYLNPATGRPFTRDEFVAFAQDYLGVDIIFWSTEAPWLQPR